MSTCTLPLRIQPESQLSRAAARDEVIRVYTEKEREYFDRGDIRNMGDVSKFWDSIKNPDGTINANYGYMVYYIRDAGNGLSQWEWAKSRLLARRDTCQAVMHFNRPKDQWDGNLDQPCCMYSQFLIRSDPRDAEKLWLHLSVSMRSNDLWFGTPYNWAYHIELMYRMAEELQETYPGLQVGNLYHHATSLHIYKRHYKKVEELLAAITTIDA